MTTFTKIADGEQPTISVYPSHKLNKIDRRIYGGFTEHMGRCIYGGIYDPDNRNTGLIDEDGFRVDVIDAMKELEIPVVRYPGGNFVATYHWLDGVGPREKRPRRPELAWNGVESNQFGTDEFMKWCEKVDAEPYLCLNFGTGTLDEALGWLEYCNSTQNTYYANLRQTYGRQQPYNVKYWALGNECWGPWQVEQLTKEDYEKKAYQWAKALKFFDPTITLILCGETGLSSWDDYVLKSCIKPDPAIFASSNSMNLIDMHSIHMYTTSDDPVKNALAPRAAERAIGVCSALIDLARIENDVPTSFARQTICFDEWNVWDSKRASGDKGAEQVYTLSDALAVAVWLNVFIRQSKHVSMANLAQSVNVISPLTTTPNGLVKQATWWPLLLFSKYMRGWNIATHVACNAYQGDTEPTWLKTTMELPWLDVSASVNDAGELSMVVVNLNLEHDAEVSLDGCFADGQDVTVHEVTADEWDAINTAERESVVLKERSWKAQDKFNFQKCSITMLRWKPQ